MFFRVWFEARIRAVRLSHQAGRGVATQEEPLEQVPSVIDVDAHVVVGGVAPSAIRLSVFDLLQRFPEIVGELPRCLQHDADKMVAGTVLSPNSLSP